MFLVMMINVTTLGANIATLLEIYEQRRDVRHERHDVVGFSSDGKVAKIQYLGLFTYFQVVPSSY